SVKLYNSTNRRAPPQSLRGKLLGPKIATAHPMDTRDLSAVHLQSENEIDNAIYALLCAAFGEDDEVSVRRAARMRLPHAPTPRERMPARSTSPHRPTAPV